MALGATKPRGIRNNNPGNLERNDTKWQGMAEDQSGDARFIVFKSPQYGIRALARTLLTYQNSHKLNTVSKIIKRWAPSGENDTEAYIQAVAGACGVGPNDVIDLDTVGVMLPFVKAIITHENGECPYSEGTLVEGIRMAGVSDAPKGGLVKKPAFVAQVVSGASVAGAACAQYAEPIRGAAKSLSDYTSAPLISHVYTVLLTLAGLATVAGILATWLRHREK